MPAINSGRNRNVSKVWYVFFFALFAFGFVLWHVSAAINEINLNNQAAMAQMNDLMTVSRQLHRQ